MRILVVNKFYWPKGGSERVMFDLSRGYEAAGHEVVPFAMASPRNRETPWAAHFAPEVDWEGGGPVRKLGHAIRVVHSREAARALRALLARERFDVAHLHNFHHQLSPSILGELRRAAVPAVHTMHDYKVVCPNYLLATGGRICEACAGGRFVSAITRRCVRGSLAASAAACVESTWHRWQQTLERGIRTFVAPSRFLADKVRALGFLGDDVRVVPNGIDPATIAPRTGAGEGFLYVGRLATEKGVPTLLDAIARAPDVRLTVAGGGPEEDRMRALARETGGDRVQFLGHVEREELLVRVAAARAVVIPSEWYENAPMSVLEAAAAAVPVVASRIGGIPELVRDGVTGRLVEPGDAAGFAEAIRALDADPSGAERLGTAARERVEQEFSLARQIETMLALLEEARS